MTELSREPLKGRVRGDKRFLRSDTRNGLGYHMADKGGWMYWCGCMKCIRIDGHQYPAVHSPGWRFIMGKRKNLKGAWK